MKKSLIEPENLYASRSKNYIDDEKMGSWSGLFDWTQVKFMVTKGMHAFEWVYYKDSASSIGKDTAWVYDIIFPENYIIKIPNKNIVTK